MALHERQHLGNSGEELVAHYLQANGYTIIARNYRKKFGEIDIIAENKESIAFVEVKNRRSIFFDLSQVITRSKQRKIIAVAKAFLLHHTRGEKACQFDIALVEGEGSAAKIQYIPRAFIESDVYGSASSY